MFVQILVQRSPWLGTEEAFRGQVPTQPDPAPQSCTGSQGSKRNLGRESNGPRLRPELRPQGGAQISGTNSGSSLTWVQSAPLAQKERKKENLGKTRQKDKECTLLASLNKSRNCFNVFTMSVLKEMCNTFTVMDAQALY